MITKSVIEAEFKQAVKECSEIVPLCNWMAQPTFITTFSHKSKHGEVSKSDHGIRITEAYLGTDLIEALRDVIRHELAHLCTNINIKKGSPAHTFVWRRVYNRFTATLDNELAEKQKTIMSDNIIKYKWSVHAILVTGEEVFVGQVHKKTAKWAKYPRTPYEKHSLNGVEIERYVFKEN